MAIERQSDPGRIKTESSDTQRDLAAKGGPAIGLGDAQNRQVPSPVNEDIGVQSAINNKGNKEGESSEEGQTKNRAGNRIPGNNH